MKIGKPFDGYTVGHLTLHDLHPGMKIQVDDGFNRITPFAVLTVQQHSDGRLYVTTNDGTPLFLDEYADDCGDNPSRGLVGFYHADPAMRDPCVGFVLVEGHVHILEEASEDGRPGKIGRRLF